MKKDHPKKKKKGTQVQEKYGSEQLAELGIFPEDDEEIIDEDDPDFWKNYV